MKTWRATRNLKTAMRAYTSNNNYRNLALGIAKPENKLSLTLARYKAGNKATPYPIIKTVAVDMQPPAVTGVSVSPSSFKPTIGQTTTINYTLSESCYVTIRVYNSAGALKRTLVNNVLQTSGLHSVAWNGKDGSNLIVPPGTYTVKIYVIDKAGNKATSARASVVSINFRSFCECSKILVEKI